MRALPEGFSAYAWAPSTETLAARASLRPSQIVRFDGNVPARPPAAATPAAVARALAGISSYAHGGYPRLVEAIARYAGVGTGNVVLGAGADDLILLCARAFAGPGDSVAVANEPTYPLFRVAAGLAGAAVNGSATPAVTFCCRPNNPSGGLVPLPDERPLVVDEAYYEYAGETAAGLLDDGVVVLRTFSKAFGLAGARLGYALAAEPTAKELNRRQSPLPVSAPSAELALAALADPPDVRPLVEERERFAAELRALGLDPWPSAANFVFVPFERPRELADALLRQGVVVRTFDDGFRVSVRDREDDDHLLRALAGDAPAPPTAHVRATAQARVYVRLFPGRAGEARVEGAPAAVAERAAGAGFGLVLEAVGEEPARSEEAARALDEALLEAGA
jgi:histidinol-phosphate aminotransferase